MQYKIGSWQNKLALFSAMLLCLSFYSHGQDSLFKPHPNVRLYPFKDVDVKNDSLKHLLQHFYFACRKNDVEASRTLKEKVDIEINNHSWKVNSGIWNYNNAYYYRINGQIDKAILFYNKSKNQFKNSKNKLALLWTELGIANCDYFLKRREVAFSKYKKLYHQAKELDDHLAANLAFNIAVSYHERYALAKNEEEKQLNTSLAQEYYQITIKNNVELKDYLGASHTFCLYGAFNSLIGQRDLASKQLDSAMVYAIKSDLKEQIAFIQINQGYHLIEENQIEKGINSIDKALNYYVRVENHNMCALAMLRKAQAYEKTKQYDLAYECTKERTRYKDLYYGQSLLDKSAFYETEFETKELQSETLEQKKRIDTISRENLILENQRLNWIIWFIILFFLLILSLIVFRFFIKNRNRKVALQKQELEIDLQRKLISETIRLQDEVRLRIGRNIHDGICQTITGLKLNQLKILKDIDAENKDFQLKLKKNIELIEVLYNETRDVSHELAPPGILHNSLKNLIRDIFRQMFVEIEYRIEDEAFNEDTFDGNTNVKLNIIRVFQELTMNIVKHSGATKVVMQAYERKNHLIFRLHDNGVGIDNTEINEGLGLQSVKSRVELLNGTFNFDSDQGLICLLKIPLE